MRVLGIESSCDETAVSVVRGTGAGLQIESNLVHTQAMLHAQFGGVVPEVASREHLLRLPGLCAQALRAAGGLQNIDGIAASRGPGLLGALLVGLQFAKGLALAGNIPFVGVNHLEGHLTAAFLGDAPPPYPHIALLVSGGHTQLYAVERFGHYALLGCTRDDAAGEAFDKVAGLVGLGYPGGARLEAAGAQGDPQAFCLPRALPGRSLDFSFSGLKTAAARLWAAAPRPHSACFMANFCASVQAAIVDVLARKAVLAARRQGLPGIVMAGGVAANGVLRQTLATRAAACGLWTYAPPRPLCTDNAAMIAAAGLLRLRAGEVTDATVSARSRWPLPELTPPPTPAPVPT